MQYPRILLPHLLLTATLALAIRSQAQSNDMTYVVTTLAGEAGTSGFVNGTTTKARFNGPADVALDGVGNIYVGDWGNGAVRRITAKGVVSTVAKRTTQSPFSPFRLAVDGSGNVYVSDSGETNAVFRIASGGPVTTLAGGGKSWGTGFFAGANYGFADGMGSAARLSGAAPAAVDVLGNVYMTDNSTVRRIATNGMVTTIAGGTVDFTVDMGVEVVVRVKSGFADGQGRNALFDFMNGSGLALDGAGNIYAADTGNHAVRKITSGGLVTTIAGNGDAGFRDGTNALLDSPSDVAVDGSGNVYVADTGNNAIRKITSAGVVTTIAGNGERGFRDGTNALFDRPEGVAVDGAGIIYVADDGNHVVRKIAPGNVISFPALPELVYSNGLSLTLAATASSKLPVMYNASSAIVSISGGNLRVLGAGTAPIVASQPGNATYPAAIPVTNTLVVRKGIAQVTISDTNAISDGTSKRVKVTTAPLGLSNIVTYNGSTTPPIVPGSYSVVASVTDANYGGSNAATLNIRMLPNEITFPALPKVTYSNGLTISLKATSSSKLPVIYGSTSSKVSISNSALKILGTGTVSIVASQLGNVTYVAALPVTNQLVIEQAPQNITFASPVVPVFSNGLTFTLSAQNNSGLPVEFSSSNPAIVSVNGNVAKINAAGTVVLTATNGGNADYKPAGASRSVTISKANQSIRPFAVTTNVPFGASVTLTNTNSTAGLPVSFQSVSGPVAISNNVATVTGVGTAVVRAVQNGNANFNAAVPLTNTFTTVKANQTISWTNFPATNAFQLNGKIPLNGTSSSGQAVTYTSANSNILRIAGTNAVMRGRGTTSVTASQAGNANYNAAPSVVRPIEIK